VRLVQFLRNTGGRGVGVVQENGDLVLVDRFPSVYEMAMASVQSGTTLASMTEANLSSERLDYDAIVKERRLLPPLDHPDRPAAWCLSRDSLI
jgi:hypothetical protein